MSNIGFNIGGKHTIRDWGLKCLGYEITFPEKQKELEQVPGRNGKIDTAVSQQSEAYGHRQIKIKCDVLDKSFEEWSDLISDIANHVQDEFLQIVPDFDSKWYYEGWVKVTPSKNYMVSSQVLFTVDAYPYKQRTRIIEVDVVDQTEVVLSNRKKASKPTITTDASVTVYVDGNTLYFSEGTSEMEMDLPIGETTITIEGTGNVVIEYQEASL